MKKLMNPFSCLLMVMLACITLPSCGGDDGSDDNSLTWDQIEGYYLAKPVSTGTKWVFWDAEGLIINSYTLTVCQCSNAAAGSGTTFPGFNSAKQSFTKTYWYYGVTGNTYHALYLNGGRAQLVDDSRYIERTSDGVRFNGQDYYNASFFNSHIENWMGVS